MDQAAAALPPRHPPQSCQGLASDKGPMLPARGDGGGRPSATPALSLLSAGGPSEGSFVLRIKSVKPSARRKWAQRQLLAHRQQFKGKKGGGNGGCLRGNLHTQLVSRLQDSCDDGGFTFPGPSLEVIIDNQAIVPAE